MAQEATQAAHTSDTVNTSGGEFADMATTNTAEALLNRIAVLEGREHALSAELAALRVDLGRLRHNLDKVRRDFGTAALVAAPPLAVFPAASSTTEGENARGVSLVTGGIIPETVPGAAFPLFPSEQVGEAGESLSSDEARIEPTDDLEATATTSAPAEFVSGNQGSAEVEDDIPEPDLSEDALEPDADRSEEGGESHVGDPYVDLADPSVRQEVDGAPFAGVRPSHAVGETAVEVEADDLTIPTVPGVAWDAAEESAAWDEELELADDIFTLPPILQGPGSTSAGETAETTSL